MQSVSSLYIPHSFLLSELQNMKQRFKRFDELLKTLPLENIETLKMLLRHLHRFVIHTD